MTRIIEHRQDAAPGEELFELRVFQLRDGDVRACVVSADLAVDLDMMADMSEPVAQAYLDALALCETESVATLWIHDPLGSFRHAIDRSRNCDEPACPPVTPPRGSEPRSPSRAEPVRERLRRPDLIDRVTGSGAGIDDLVVQGRQSSAGKGWGHGQRDLCAALGVVTSDLRFLRTAMRRTRALRRLKSRRSWSPRH